jgi:hypothetical protein
MRVIRRDLSFKLRHPKQFLTGIYVQRLLAKLIISVTVLPPILVVRKTPAEACGIKIEGENKWLTLIQNASKTTKGN